MPGPMNNPPSHHATGYELQNPYTTATADQMPGVAYQQALAQQQQSLLSNQMNLALAGSGEQQAFMTGNLGRQLAGQKLDVQDLGTQLGALGRQETLTQQQRGMQKTGFRLQEQQMNLGKKDMRQQGALQKEQMRNQIASDTSQAAGSGSLFTAGHRANQTYMQHAQKLIKDELSRALTNWNIQRRQLGISEHGAALTYKEQRAQQHDQEKNLSIIAKRLDLSKQDIKARTQSAINQLQLGTAASVNDIMQAMVDSAKGLSTPYDAILGQIYGITGINPAAGGPAGG